MAQTQRGEHDPYLQPRLLSVSQTIRNFGEQVLALAMRHRQQERYNDTSLPKQNGIQC